MAHFAEDRAYLTKLSEESKRRDSELNIARTELQNRIKGWAKDFVAGLEPDEAQAIGEELLRQDRFIATRKMAEECVTQDRARGKK